MKSQVRVIDYKRTVTKQWLQMGFSRRHLNTLLDEERPFHKTESAMWEMFYQWFFHEPLNAPRVDEFLVRAAVEYRRARFAMSLAGCISNKQMRNPEVK